MSTNLLGVRLLAAMRPKWGLALATLALALGGGTARAQAPVATAGAAAGSTNAAGTEAPAKPSDAPLPSCLDQTIAGELGETLKPRGVQKKNFLKRHKINLVAHGGLYAGDLTSSAWIDPAIADRDCSHACMFTGVRLSCAASAW